MEDTTSAGPRKKATKSTDVRRIRHQSSTPNKGLGQEESADTDFILKEFKGHVPTQKGSLSGAKKQGSTAKVQDHIQSSVRPTGSSKASKPVSHTKFGNSASSTTAVSEEEGPNLNSKWSKPKARLNRSNTTNLKPSLPNNKTSGFSRLEEIKEHTPQSKIEQEKRNPLPKKNNPISQAEAQQGEKLTNPKPPATPKVAGSSKSGTANFRVTNKSTINTARVVSVPNTAVGLSDLRSKYNQNRDFQMPSPQTGSNRAQREVEELYNRGELYSYATHFRLLEQKERSMKKQKSQSPISQSNVTDNQRTSSKDKHTGGKMDALEDDFTIDVTSHPHPVS